jgi:hypothetical protein
MARGVWGAEAGDAVQEEAMQHEVVQAEVVQDEDKAVVSPSTRPPT